MQLSLLGFLVLLCFASEASAPGSIAYGYDAANTIHFFASQNQPTERDAEAAAFAACRTLGLNSCQTLHNFENTCAAVALTFSNAQIGYGTDVTMAGRNAISRCLSDRHE